jgi:thiaminase
MKIELVRVKQEKFNYYLRLDGNFVIDPRFIYDQLQAGKEKFDHIREIASKFGEIDYQIGELNDVIDETVILSDDINKGNSLYINKKVSGRYSIK